MKHVRSLIRALALMALTLATAAILLLSLPLKRFASRLQLRLRNALFRGWARAFCGIAGMRTSYEGTPPAGSFFLVVNHLSYMDVILLGTAVDAAFVARADLRRWLAVGWLFAIADTIFIDRGRRRDVVRVLDRLEAAMDRDLGVIVFPESWASGGQDIRPFKPSLLELATRRGLPVHFATISYAAPEGHGPGTDLICWWGGRTPFVPHILRLLSMPRFEARLRFGPAPLAGSDRKALAARLRAAMFEIFTAVT